MNKVLIVTAVEQERDAVKRGIADDPRFDVIAGGVGLAEAAVSTAFSLSKTTYSTVVNAGIGGGFEPQTRVGSMVVASDIWAADLGSETEIGFLSLDELELGSSKYCCNRTYVKKIEQQIATSGIEVQTGPILTTATATGTAKRADELIKRVPGAKVEAMEGFGVATASIRANVPVYEIRAISNAVGPRDRDNWKIKQALAALQQTGNILREVF